MALVDVGSYRPRVLLVEDEPSLRRALTTSLTAEGYEVREASDGTEAVEHFTAFRPDLVLLDVRLPDGREGFTVGREMRAAAETPIIFLTAVDGAEERLDAFSLGADDYVSKPFSMPELIARSRAVLRRSTRLLSGRICVRDVVIDLEARVASRAETPLNLTSTEFRLLVCLARSPGRIFSKIQLLSEVWEFEAYDVNLVEVHISALRRKLEALGPRLIFTERGAGYVIRP